MSKKTFRASLLLVAGLTFGGVGAGSALADDATPEPPAPAPEALTSSEIAADVYAQLWFSLPEFLRDLLPTPPEADQQMCILGVEEGVTCTDELNQ